MYALRASFEKWHVREILQDCFVACLSSAVDLEKDRSTTCGCKKRIQLYLGSFKILLNNLLTKSELFLKEDCESAWLSNDGKGALPDTVRFRRERYPTRKNMLPPFYLPPVILLLGEVLEMDEKLRQVQ